MSLTMTPSKPVVISLFASRLSTCNYLFAAIYGRPDVRAITSRASTAGIAVFWKGGGGVRRQNEGIRVFVRVRMGAGLFSIEKSVSNEREREREREREGALVDCIVYRSALLQSNLLVTTHGLCIITPQPINTFSS